MTKPDGFGLYETTRQVTLSLTATLSQDQLDFAGDGWSIGQVMDHLAKSDAIHRTEVLRAVEAARSDGQRVHKVGFADVDAAPKAIPPAALPMLEIPFRAFSSVIPTAARDFLVRNPIISARSPGRAEPEVGRPGDELRRALQDSVEESRTCLSESQDVDVESLIIDHPLMGRNTTPELFRVQALHEQRHQDQIRRCMEAPGFPGARGPAAVSISPTSDTAVPAVDTHLPLAALEREAEETIRDSRVLIQWFRDNQERLDFFDLVPGFEGYYELRSFFDFTSMAGQTLPITGCVQRHRFRRRPGAPSDSRSSIETFIDHEFLSRCHRLHQDGLAGGFRYRPLCHRDSAGDVGRGPLPLDLAAFRRDHRWVALRVDILDFIRSHPILGKWNSSLSKYVKESAYVVTHKDLDERLSDPPEGVLGERRFGYGFMPRQVEPNAFGFGPGHFGAAAKQWRFLLHANGDVEVQIVFLVAPRSEKVLNIAGLDPVYTGIEMANIMTGGVLGLNDKAHDFLDKTFMEHHGRVHADAIFGLRDVWENQQWMKDGDQRWAMRAALG